jgi:hypothetical protein
MRHSFSCSSRAPGTKPAPDVFTVQSLSLEARSLYTSVGDVSRARGWAIERLSDQAVERLNG